MNVVTLAVQNHCAATTKISWWLNTDHKKTNLAEFLHDFSLFTVKPWKYRNPFFMR